MSFSASTTARRCEFCGEELVTTEVVLFGVTREVTCYGSCGCQRSRERLESFGPLERTHSFSGHRCPKCGGSMNLDDATGYVSDCPWCGHSMVFKSDLDAYREGRRVERAVRSGGVLSGTGVPELFWDVEPDYSAADEIDDTGRGLYIRGGNGTAKTLMAAAIAKAYAERGKAVRFASSVKLLADFKDTYGTSKSEAEVFDDLNGCDLLVIDDMGKENPTSWAATMLYAVIDGRYGSKRPVVVTTNYTEGALAARLAQAMDESTARALMSRLFEMTREVVLDGPDRRLAQSGKVSTRQD